MFFLIFEFSTVIQKKDVACASTAITILYKQINKIFEKYLLRPFKQFYI